MKKILANIIEYLNIFEKILLSQKIIAMENYFNERHQQHSINAQKQIEEWRKSPVTYSLLIVEFLQLGFQCFAICMLLRRVPCHCCLFEKKFFIGNLQ